MKKLGLIGGLAWPSTIDYYRLLCQRSMTHYRALGATGLLPTPPVMIESLVMAETRKLRGSEAGGDGSWASFDAVFRDAFLRLESAGCEVLAIASNTPHARLRSIRAGISAPIVSILSASVSRTVKAGFSHALVLGTAVTMRADDYSMLLAQHEIIANDRLPDKEIDDMQRMIDEDFYDKSEAGLGLGREKLLKVCRSNVENPNTTAVLLACTELPLAFQEHADEAVFCADGFHFINTTVAHVDAILGAMLAGSTAEH